MKKMNKYITIALLAFLAPQVSNAQGAPRKIQDIFRMIIEAFEQFIFPILIGLGVFSFLVGVLKYIRGAGDPKARAEGNMFMLWGLVGLAVMVSVWGLVSILTSTFGLNIGSPTVLPPTNPQ